MGDAVARAANAVARGDSGRQAQLIAQWHEALAALEGKTLEQVKVQSTGPGSFLVTLGVEGLELSVRLDRAGARIHSVGV